MRQLSRCALIAGSVAGLCLVVGLLVANFDGGEAKIEHRIERLYSLDDPCFVQKLGVLPGPPLFF